MVVEFFQERQNSKSGQKIKDKSVVCWFFLVVVRSQQKPMYERNLESSLHSNIFTEKGFHSTTFPGVTKKLAEVLFIVYPKKTMQRVVEVKRWTLWYHLNNFTMHRGRGWKVSCVPTMKATVLLFFKSWLSPVYIFIPYWTMKHSVDHTFEMDHLGPKASHQAPEGLPKDGMNNRTFRRPPQMKSCCQPIFSSFSLRLINLKVKSSLSQGHKYSIIGSKVSRS